MVSQNAGAGKCRLPLWLGLRYKMAPVLEKKLLGAAGTEGHTMDTSAEEEEGQNLW